ncbi:MAG: hypothetical protein ACPGJS_11395 [Flammeovirgaceae bacterium]
MLQIDTTGSVVTIHLQPSQPILVRLYNLLLFTFFISVEVLLLYYNYAAFSDTLSSEFSTEQKLGIHASLLLFPLLLPIVRDIWKLLNAGGLGKASLNIDHHRNILYYQKNFLFFKLSQWEVPFQSLSFLKVGKAKKLNPKLQALNKIWDHSLAIIIDNNQILSSQLYLKAKDIEQLAHYDI